ncbi:MAG: ThuA domain-containing protein [Gemmataceae bacterium]|nr:ThuA domain-containing protein [Gemmataceae bacterium]MDW8265301.1 ThuA domain-containing protein [Gemmataceae bacterium]
MTWQRRWLGLGWAVILGWAVSALGADQAVPAKIRVLIIDGQNNHNWRETTPRMKKILEECGRFTVDVATAPEKPRVPPKPKTDDPAALAKYAEAKAAAEKALPAYQAAMAKFRPAIENYDVVLSNYNGDPWPAEFQTALDDAVKSGRLGLVIVHAANNAFPGWKEYNQMIGMGWRSKDYGDRLKLDDTGALIRVPKGADEGSGHRYTGEFAVVIRDPQHPITRGMPREWMHARDELYDNMRGPIENVHLLATAYSKGTKAHEPMIWTVAYGKGRVFHTPMGHDVAAMRCVGFAATLQRGTEWAATGEVTIPLPANFPGPEKSSTAP